MKYVSRDDLEKFYYFDDTNFYLRKVKLHNRDNCFENTDDSEMASLNEWINSVNASCGLDLTIEVDMLVIKKHTEQNPDDHAKEIEEARLSIKNVQDVVYSNQDVYTELPDGSHKCEFGEAVTGKEAVTVLLDHLFNEFTIHSFFSLSKNRYCIYGCSPEPFFKIEFSCDDIAVEWDKYIGLAWFELRRRHTFDMRITSSKGDQTVHFSVIDEFENDPETEDPISVQAFTEYEEQGYFGYGTDFLWLDAIAELENKLPGDAHFECCLTCRFGNHCPYGNNEDELFCMKGCEIKDKSDLCFYLNENNIYPDENKKRLKRYSDYCEDYQAFSDEFYTYNYYEGMGKRK